MIQNPMFDQPSFCSFSYTTLVIFIYTQNVQTIIIKQTRQQKNNTESNRPKKQGLMAGLRVEKKERNDKEVGEGEFRRVVNGDLIEQQERYGICVWVRPTPIILLITEQHNQVEKLLYINKYKPLMDDFDKFNQKNRSYVCSCGKAYLSYAALFTHIKHKHNGQAPGPIIRPRSQRKRGRPKKITNSENSLLPDDKIHSSPPFLSPNKILFDKQFEFIQYGSLKNGQQRTMESASLLGCTQFQTFKPFGFSSAFSVYNSDLPQNPLQRLKSENIHEKQSKVKEKQYDSDNVSQKISTPKTVLAERQSEEKFQCIIKRLKNFCQEITPDQMMKLRVSFQISKSKSLLDQQIEGNDSILAKIKSFHNFLKENLTQPEQFQVFIIIILIIENIIEQKKQTTLLFSDNLSLFLRFVNTFFERDFQEEAKQRKLSCLHVCQDFMPTQILVQFLNWESLQNIMSQQNATKLENDYQTIIY